MKVLVVSNVDQISDLEEVGKGLFMCLAKWSLGFAAKKLQIALIEVVSDRWTLWHWYVYGASVVFQSDSLK